MPRFNLKTIVGHVGDHPLLEPNRFEVIVTGPEGINVTQPVMFNCHVCDIPGHNIGSFDHTIVGPQRKIPNEEIYDDLSTTFINSHHLEELKIIDKWMQLIGGDRDFYLPYYNEIISDMHINVYDLQENLTSTVLIFEAYPIGCSEVQLSYGGEMPSEMTVNWTYHSFKIESH